MIHSQYMNKKHLIGTLSLFYFSFFAGLGIIIPFFPLYCKHLNFSALQIGVLSAIMPFSKVLFPPIWAMMADHFQIRKGITLLTSLISLLIFVFFFYVETFKMLALIMFIFSFFRVAVLPLVEATTLEKAEENNLHYGRIRIWGSVGFIMMSLLIGKIIDIHSTRVILYALFAATTINFLSILKIPAPTRFFSHMKTPICELLKQKKIIIFFTACMFMQVSHGTYYGFFTIYLENVGYTKSIIGFLWALGVITEIIVLYFSQRLITSLGLLISFAASFLLASLRWSVYALTDSLFLLTTAQTFHAFSYGVFHVAAISYTYNQFPGKTRAFGQSLYGGITFGAGSIIGLMLNGVFYEMVGPTTLFAASSVIAFSGFLLSLYLMIKQS